MAGGFGAFGKMPTVGDFFRLNTPSGFVSVWDDWLQTAILAGQRALGSGWDDHYMSAPIWRFSLTAGIAGKHKTIGVLMPSVDRVGRRYPLTLMTALPTPAPAPLDHFRSAPLFERLEEIALDALDDDMNREQLQERLAAIEPPQAQAASVMRKLGRSLVLSGAGDLLPDLAAVFVGKSWIRPSLWSAVVDGTERLLVCDGLPEGDEVQGLFQLDAPVWSEGVAA
jgi:type VI secretion system protein ImpM